MSEQWNGLDLAGLAESLDLECKAAQGRDGKGELPEDFWKSYSAMANADGGIILLGVQEKPRGEFPALSLVEVERVRKAQPCPMTDEPEGRAAIPA
jgi:predicted HTH transcriptional regulator